MKVWYDDSYRTWGVWEETETKKEITSLSELSDLIKDLSCACDNMLIVLDVSTETNEILLGRFDANY